MPQQQQQPGYRPFPIYDYTSGLHLEKEPWLIPNKAFADIENFRVNRGILSKRRGYSLFGKPSDNPITGIFSYWSVAGDRQLLVFDTRRIYRYDEANEEWTDIEEEDVFSGSASDYMAADLWHGNMYISNDVDPIQKYDGSSLTELPKNTPDGDINHTLWPIIHKERLLILRPTIAGVIRSTRVQWTAPGTDDDWDNGGYLEAPSIDWIVSYSFIGDRLIVYFERSIWALNYVGEADMPFQWEKLMESEGGAAPFSGIQFSDEAIILGPTRFISTDGMTLRNFGDQIRDYVLDINQEAYDTVFGAIVEEEREIWWNYPEVGENMPNRNIVYNYFEDTWYRFDIPIQVIGYHRSQYARTWEKDIAWEDATFTWTDRAGQAGFPLTLGGAQDGKVYLLNDTYQDEGEDYIGYARFKPLNPFIESGRSVRLGYLDIYYSIDDATAVDINFYDNESLDPYLTKTISLTGPEDQKKHMRRLVVNRDAAFHSIEIRSQEKDQIIEIHAIVPWMKPTGRIIHGRRFLT